LKNRCFGGWIHIVPSILVTYSQKTSRVFQFEEFCLTPGVTYCKNRYLHIEFLKSDQAFSLVKHCESWVVWMAIASCASPRRSHATKCLLCRQTESQRDFVHHRRLARAGRVACLRCVRGVFKVVKCDISGVLREVFKCSAGTPDGADTGSNGRRLWI